MTVHSSGCKEFSKALKLVVLTSWIMCLFSQPSFNMYSYDSPVALIKSRHRTITVQEEHEWARLAAPGVAEGAAASLLHAPAPVSAAARGNAAPGSTAASSPVALTGEGVQPGDEQQQQQEPMQGVEGPLQGQQAGQGAARQAAGGGGISTDCDAAKELKERQETLHRRAVLKVEGLCAAVSQAEELLQYAEGTCMDVQVRQC